MSLPLEIDVASVATLLKTPSSMLLLDCREQIEFDRARIEGATLIPMGEIEDRIAELEPHRHDHIVVYCHHGRRSLIVTNALRQQGFDQVQSMAGGIEEWSLEVDSNVPRY